jgi:hypothetical protein
MGVVPPSEKDFLDARGNPIIHNVSSPTEGIVVLEPPPVPTEEKAALVSTQDVHASNEPLEAEPVTVSFNSKKKQKKNLAENSP